MKIGFSHDVVFSENEDISIEVPAPNKIIVSGTDKQKVGQFAAEIREKRPPEPYKGKGIRYAGEYVRRKEGKTGKGGK
jgi:large subunit ribosomal protein L6